MAFFKILANDTRLRLLHALVRAEQMCVTDPVHLVGAVVGVGPEQPVGEHVTWVIARHDDRSTRGQRLARERVGEGV